MLQLLFSEILPQTGHYMPHMKQKLKDCLYYYIEILYHFINYKDLEKSGQSIYG